MKNLTYKILKEETQEKPKIEFNRDFYLNELRKEVGLLDIPYEKLGDYKVQLNSPTGRSSSFSINAKEYVDNELANIEKDIDAHNATTEIDPEPTFDIVTVSVDEKQEILVRKAIESSDDFWEWVDEKPPIAEVKMDQKLENFRYFEVKIPDNEISFVVVIFDDGTQEIKDQINTVKKHFCTKGLKKREFLTGYETVINFYQWTNLVSALAPKTDYLSFEDINKRMDTVFQGVEGLDLPEGF